MKKVNFPSSVVRSIFAPAALLFSAMTYASSYSVISSSITYDVRTDATYAYEESGVWRINDEQGLKQLAQLPLPYSESLQTLEVLDAYTVTKDGQRHDVTPAQIITQQSPVSNGAPMYSDQKYRIVVFPQAEIGAELHLHYKRTQLKPYLPGVFSMQEIFNKTVEIKQADVTLRAPATMALQFDVEGVQGGVAQATEGSVREWRWSIENAAATAAEPGSVSEADYSPHVTVSNLASYESLAKAYYASAQPAAKVTPAIQKQADNITQGISDKRAQAEAIYRWVSSNIRYVAIFLNVGGFVPHNAEDVLKAGYGDCKDHATLLESLLAAKGINSSQVLVNASNAYRLPKVAALEAFNHDITYLPDYQLFVDATSGFGRFGVLTDGASGKSALVVNTGKGKSELLSTPLINAQNDGIRIRTEATVSKDGTMQGANVVQLTGVFDLLHRAVLASIPKPQIAQAAASLLARSGQTGTGDIKFGDARDLSQAFTYEADFQLPNRVALPGPGAFTDAAGISSPLGIASFAFGNTATDRKLPFPCLGGLREETAQLTLPDNLKINSMPKAAKITSKFGSYESSYAREGNKIIVKRKLDLAYPQATCNSADYVEIKAMASAVGQDLRAQYLYQ